ncbi:MAG: substrate-binding domain-containing protein, partial [Gemmatimonadota bacterium]
SGGHRAARRLLEARPRPTAIFAANDSMAIGALRALQEAGLAVPDDVALGGFDDIPMASYTNPPLSTVHVPIHRLGARAVQRLLRALREPDAHEPRAETLPTSLRIRASSRRGAEPERGPKQNEGLNPKDRARTRTEQNQGLNRND